MRLSITRKIAMGFGLLFVLLAAISMVAILNGFALVRNSAVMFRSHTALSHLADVSIMTRDVQTGYRGFVITGQEAFLEHYTAADALILKELDQLLEICADIPQQSARIGRLRSLIEGQLQHGREVIDIRRREGLDAASALVQSGKGKGIMDDVRILTEESIAGEKETLRRCRVDAETILRRTVLTAILGGTLGLLALGSAMFVLHVDIRERERLEKALLTAGDREQQRIGQDIHDGLCQQLAGVAYLTQTLRENLQTVSKEGAAAAGRISELVSAAVAEARHLSHGLHPVELVEDGLMLALEDLAAATEKTFDISCCFECPGPVLLADNEAALHVYRIAQEAVHNAVRHAHPNQITILLRKRGDRVAIEVSDDGSGMVREADGSRGIGLQTMRFRANRLGGDLVCRPAPGGGTSVVCSFPASITVEEKPPAKDAGGAGEESPASDEAAGRGIRPAPEGRIPDLSEGPGQ